MMNLSKIYEAFGKLGLRIAEKKSIGIIAEDDILLSIRILSILLFFESPNDATDDEKNNIYSEGIRLINTI